MVPPVLQSLWLADDAARGENGKLTVQNVFNLVTLPKSSRGYFRPFVIVFIVNSIHGRADLQLKFFDTADMSVKYVREVTVTAVSPLEVVDVVAEGKSMPARRAGCYCWELYAGHELLGSTRVWVKFEE